MIAEYKIKADKFVFFGILLILFGFLFRAVSFELGIVLSLIGYVFFIVGCINYAKAKGYPGVLGLLGLLNLIGLIIIVILPDKK